MVRASRTWMLPYRTGTGIRENPDSCPHRVEAHRAERSISRLPALPRARARRVSKSGHAAMRYSWISPPNRWDARHDSSVIRSRVGALACRGQRQRGSVSQFRQRATSGAGPGVSNNPASGFALAHFYWRRLGRPKSRSWCGLTLSRWRVGALASKGACSVHELQAEAREYPAAAA